MFCPSCENRIDDQAKFCPYCGTAVTPQNTPQEIPAQQTAQPVIPTAPTPAFEAAQNAAPEGKKKPKREKKPKAPKVQKTPQGTLSVGAALTSAFLMMELAPYLLRSIIMTAGKTALTLPVYCLCAAAGYALAFWGLLISSKLMGGRSPLPSALLLTGVFGAYRAASPMVISAVGEADTQITMIVICALFALGCIAAAAACASALGGLFVTDGQKHGGKFAAAVCALLAFAVPTVLQTALYFVPIERTPSFLGTASGFMLIAVLESALFTLGAKAILRRNKPGAAAASPGRIAMIAGGAAAVCAAVLMFIGNTPQNVLIVARNDVVSAFFKADAILTTGDANTALHFMNLTGERCEAWASVADGGSYSVPQEYSHDQRLLYLSYLNNENDLQKYMINELDPEDIDVFGPLMLDHYAKREELSENEQAHRAEIIGLCVGQGVFLNSQPTMTVIEKNKDELTALSGAESAYSKYLRTAEIFADIQRGDTSVSSAINELLDIAEEYPDDVRLQSIASILGSENKWDGAGHYHRTAEAILRFLRCMERNPEVLGDSSKLSQVKNTAGEMLLNIKEYDKAEKVLDDALALDPKDKAIKQNLARCYMEIGSNDKSFSLAKEMSKDYPDDVSVLWTLCVSSLKKKDTSEAIRAASLLADAVKGGNLEGDSLLFNCVSYLSMQDNTAGYKNMVYSDDTADEPVKQIMQNTFLDDCCAAVYYGIQGSDYEKALDHVDKALSAQNKSSRLWYLKGVILFNMEDFEKSEEALLKADALDPNDLAIMYALANTYDGMEEYKKAYEYADRVVAKYPNGADHDEDVFGAAPHAAGLRNRLKSYVEGGN